MQTGEIMVIDHEIERQLAHPIYRAIENIEKHLTKIQELKTELKKAMDRARPDIKNALDIICATMHELGKPMPLQIRTSQGILVIEDEWWDQDWLDILDAVALQPDPKSIWDLAKFALAAEDAGADAQSAA
jgi:hypothetical protein